MSASTMELSEAELDALIERVEEAIAHQLSLSVEDLQLLLGALKSLAHMQERLADNSITLQKLRKLAGIVHSSEKFSRLSGRSSGDKKPPKKSPKKPKADKPGVEPVIQITDEPGAPPPAPEAKVVSPDA